MVNVLLLYVSADLQSIDQRRSIISPTGLYFLAACLRSAGISTEVVNFSTMSPEEQRSCLERYRPRYVGISMLTLNRFSALESADFIKKKLPEAKIILGGPHATFLAEELMLRTPEIDCVVCGEGEETLLELIRCWEHGGDPCKVNGIVFRDMGKPVRTLPRPLMKDLSTLPHPAEWFPEDRIITSRGCPFQCGFCASSQFWGRGIRFHSSDWVLDEIELLYRKHGIRELKFSDDLLTLDKDRVIAICKGIVKKRIYIRFRCMSRVNTICSERLEWLKRAGCYRIDYGVESGSARILKAMGKRITPDEVADAFRMTRAAGIGAGCFLIVGYPGENAQSIAETKELVRRIRPTFLDISSMAIFPNSPVYLELVRTHQVSPNVWFDLKEPTLFLTEDGKKEQYLSYISELRNDFDRQAKSDSFSTDETAALYRRCETMGHISPDWAKTPEGGEWTENSLEVLANSVRCEPDNPLLWHRMAELCLQLGDAKLAGEAVRRAIDLQPNNYDSRCLSARIHARLGETDTAVSEYKMAIRTRPDKIEAYLEQGELYQKLGRWHDAHESFLLSLRIDPFWPPIKEALKTCQQQMTGEVSYTHG